MEILAIRCYWSLKPFLTSHGPGGNQQGIGIKKEKHGRTEGAGKVCSGWKGNQGFDTETREREMHVKRKDILKRNVTLKYRTRKK